MGPHLRRHGPSQLILQDNFALQFLVKHQSNYWCKGYVLDVINI